MKQILLPIIITSTLLPITVQAENSFRYKIPQPQLVTNDWDGDGQSNDVDTDDDNDGILDTNDDNPFSGRPNIGGKSQTPDASAPTGLTLLSGSITWGEDISVSSQPGYAAPNADWGSFAPTWGRESQVNNASSDNLSANASNPIKLLWMGGCGIGYFCVSLSVDENSPLNIGNDIVNQIDKIVIDGVDVEMSYFSSNWYGPYNADGEFYQSRYTTISSLNTIPGFIGTNFNIGESSNIEIVTK